MEPSLEALPFDGPDLTQNVISIDPAYVDRMMADVVRNENLSRNIL